MPSGRQARVAAFAVSVVAAGSPVVAICGAAAAARTAGLARARAETYAAIASAAGPPVAVASPDRTKPAGAGHPSSPIHPPAAPQVAKPTNKPAAAPVTTGCAWALAYLRANAAPGSSLNCGGYAMGHQAMTVTTCGPGGCSNRIVIHTVCEASVKNEAWNSLHPQGPIDPFGHC